MPGTTAAQPTPEPSPDILRALWAYQEAYSLTEYCLAEMAGVTRSTICRWRRRPVELTAKTIEHLLNAINERSEKATAAHAALAHLLTIAQEKFVAAQQSPTELIRRSLNAKRRHGNAVVAEIDALGLQLSFKET